MIDPSVLLAVSSLIVGLGGVIGALINSWLSAKKTQLDTVTSRLQSAIDASNHDNDRLRQRLDEVEKDNIELRKELRQYEVTVRDLNFKLDNMEIERRSNVRRIEVLEDQVSQLEKQLIDAGITPVTRKEL